MFFFLITVSFIIIFVKFRYFSFEAKGKKSLEWQEFLRNSTLETRANSNQRLVFAYGIDNAFTTMHQDVYKRFLVSVAKILKKNDKDWEDLAKFASKCVRARISNVRESEKLRLLPLVQTVTMLFVIRLCQFDMNPSDAEVEGIATSINTLWINSKRLRDQKIQQIVRGQKEDLLKHLSHIINQEVEEGQNNPLNFLIPAYETTWRVVLRCFLEVRFRCSQSKRKLYLKTIENFLDNCNFKTFGEGKKLLPMVAIVREALRLYPPTRKIYRNIKGVEKYINIEEIHQNVDVWGQDSKRFLPCRWVTENKAYFSNYIPFGMGPFKCPASGRVAPMMIGILTSALVVSTSDELALSEDLGIDPLSNERNSLTNLELVSKL